ncbi:Uncharacterized protein Rs2_13420 [Raphanus sativus]|uniref:Uncharacterized protein LOC108851727 n=1 Tax=Raphanus sativus TaxID=3726 RepID=A0A6J0N822_RAPSA|nr:uncharacterized protein LOC108851727 [Raphanus sativus]XP_056866014.1 uncharacterized protein LOC130511999 [Raphanus sativus]KAJ4872982.1 Uncharacterized protein Rs2_45364 [Raphanus sativus]KAJ4899469.1 Uncharacterized protein Rs2_13420 [Raphanus sativus]
MEKLARRWRRTRRDDEDEDDDKLVLPTFEDIDSRPIDTQEQEEYVRSLEEAHAQQSRQWKRVFAVLLVCYGAFLFYSIFQQFMSPWELRYHAYFMEDLNSWMVISAEWIAIMACCLSIVGLLDKKNDHRRWFLYSCLPGSALTIFWLYYLLRLPKFRWDVIWLPFAPLCGAGICLYVDHLLEESSEEVKKLRNYMYAYKAR